MVGLCPEYIDEEIRNVYDIGCSLKYPKHLLDTAYHSARKTFYNPQPKPTFSQQNLLILPYRENLVEVPKLLRHFNVNVVFRNNNTVKQLLINNSVECQKGCVYKIPCKMCHQFYVGQTAKPLKIRIDQHKKCVREGNQSSGIFMHCNLHNHPIDWNNAKSITFSNNIVVRNLIECSLINVTQDDNVNIHQGLYKLDNYMCKEISKLFKL